eukprot:g10450.t1
MLSLVGLGLGSPDDVTIRGKKAIEAADVLFLDSYTAILPLNKKSDEDDASSASIEQVSVSGFHQLQDSYPGKRLVLADRELVESATEIFAELKTGKKVAFLVVGDPLCATTHTDLILRCRQRGFAYEVVHNASIMNAISSCGLQLYRFGETISVPFWTEKWRPDSFYDKLVANRNSQNSHTLCLLDIQVKERSEENMRKGIMNVFEPPRFMSVRDALHQLRQIAINRFCNTVRENHGASSKGGAGGAAANPITPDSEGVKRALGEEAWLVNEKNLVGVARIGAADQKIAVGTLWELMEYDFGGPLHALVVPAKELHECEEEFLDEAAARQPEVEEKIAEEEDGRAESPEEPANYEDEEDNHNGDEDEEEDGEEDQPLSFSIELYALKNLTPTVLVPSGQSLYVRTWVENAAGRVLFYDTAASRVDASTGTCRLRLPAEELQENDNDEDPFLVVVDDPADCAALAGKLVRLSVHVKKKGLEDLDNDVSKDECLGVAQMEVPDGDDAAQMAAMGCGKMQMLTLTAPGGRNEKQQSPGEVEVSRISYASK